MLLHNNTPVHCVIRVHQFLAQRNLLVFVHCTPLIWYQEISFIFFPEEHRKWLFADVAAIQEHVTADSFLKLYEHCQRL